jgi:hypothetical protein
MDTYLRLLEFLCLLDDKHVHYTLEHNREEAIMVVIATPTKHWEIQFFSDGHVEAEEFVSVGFGDVHDADTELERFWRDNGE